MTNDQAVIALAAVAQINRLEIFRLLIRLGEAGLPAGEIATRCDLSPTRCSFHLKELEHAGLINSRREGRFIRYAITVPAVRDLISFLTEDCCDGRPDMCGNALAARASDTETAIATSLTRVVHRESADS